MQPMHWPLQYVTFTLLQHSFANPWVQIIDAKMKTVLLFLFSSFIMPLAAQNMGPDSAAPASAAKIRFAFDYDKLELTHYDFEVAENCQGTYTSRSKPDPQSLEVETLNREIKLSPATCTRIFDLAKSANYFSGNFDYTKNKIAFTGKKTLSYSDPARNGSTSFNWSENPAINELAETFQGISTTLEAEPRLRRLRRFDKLGLNAELAKLEQQADSGWLKEIGLISDLLQEIAQDKAIMGLARHRAERLLQVANSQHR